MGMWCILKKICNFDGKGTELYMEKERKFIDGERAYLKT